MDFFERQEQARQSTRWLVLYFALAVTLTIAAVYLVAVIGLSQVNQPELEWWNPKLAVSVSLIVGFIIALGSSLRIYQLSHGGTAVAVELGGKPVNRFTADINEQKLLNIVEEMSIASGTPMPEVYVLNEERGINAFAAGYRISDTAIGVTRGAVERLSRDELQGVIAHEFSHILHGDMRLNMRLSCLTFGILFISLTGRQLLKLPFRIRISGRSNKKGGAAGLILAILAIGLALCVIGAIGYFFTRLIQAAVCRQREFLADASAVQFTRNPDGIAGALAKIAKLPWRGALNSPQASKAEHFLFSSGGSDLWEKMFSTHPPVVERILAINPRFDFTTANNQPAANDQEEKPLHDKQLKAALGLPKTMAQVISQTNSPSPAHFALAAEIRGALPDVLLHASREIFSAKALVYGLLLADDDSVQQRQNETLRANHEEIMEQEVAKLRPALQNLDANHRLPLINLTIPALRNLSPAQYQVFIQTVDQLVIADNHFSLFEFALKKIIHHQLDPVFGGRVRAKVKYHALLPLMPSVSTLIANLAYGGSSLAEEIDSAFRQGMAQLNISGQTFTLPGEEIYNLNAIDAALEEIALATPLIKKNILFACSTTVMTDGGATTQELEILRAIAAALDCPIPPFVKH